MAITINGTTNTITGLAVGGLPNGVVDTDMLADDAVTAAKTTVPGITEYDMWVLDADLTGSQAPITATFARPTTSAIAQYIGTGMSQSSGVFTFPNTGKWLVTFKCNIKGTNLVEVYGRCIIELTTDGGTNWNFVSRGNGNMTNSGGLTNYEMGHAEALVDVTSVSDVKVRFATTFSNSSTKVVGYGPSSDTSVSFMKLGDT